MLEQQDIPLSQRSNMNINSNNNNLKLKKVTRQIKIKFLNNK